MAFPHTALRLESNMSSPDEVSTSSSLKLKYRFTNPEQESHIPGRIIVLKAVWGPFRPPLLIPAYSRQPSRDFEATLSICQTRSNLRLKTLRTLIVVQLPLHTALQPVIINLNKDLEKKNMFPVSRPGSYPACSRLACFPVSPSYSPNLILSIFL